MEKSIILAIAPSWEEIEIVRSEIEKQLESVLSAETIHTALICATELTENAVKYGVAVPSARQVGFRLTLDGEEMVIKVSSGVQKNEDMDNVCSTIDKFKESDDLELLYIERMTELMEQTEQGKSMLGLFRIVNETGFQLDYDIVENVLTVTASRMVN